MRRTFVATKGFHAPRPSGGAPSAEAVPPPAPPPPSSAVALATTSAATKNAPATPLSACVTDTASGTCVPSSSTASAAAKSKAAATNVPASAPSPSASASPRKSARKSTLTSKTASRVNTKTTSAGNGAGCNAHNDGSSSSTGESSSCTVSAMLGGRNTLSGHFSANHLRRGLRRDEANSAAADTVMNSAGSAPASAIPNATTGDASATTAAAAGINGVPLQSGVLQRPDSRLPDELAAHVTANARGEAAEMRNGASSRKRSRSPTAHATVSATLSDAAQSISPSRANSAEATGDAYVTSLAPPLPARASRRLSSRVSASQMQRHVFYPPPAELAADAPWDDWATTHADDNIATASATVVAAAAAVLPSVSAVEHDDVCIPTQQSNVPFALLFAPSGSTSARVSAAPSTPRADLPLSSDFQSPEKADDAAEKVDGRLLSAMLPDGDSAQRPSGEGGTATSSSSAPTSQPGTWFLSALEHQQREQQHHHQQMEQLQQQQQQEAGQRRPNGEQRSPLLATADIAGGAAVSTSPGGSPYTPPFSIAEGAGTNLHQRPPSVPHAAPAPPSAQPLRAAEPSSEEEEEEAELLFSQTSATEAEKEALQGNGALDRSLASAKLRNLSNLPPEMPWSAGPRVHSAMHGEDGAGNGTSSRKHLNAAASTGSCSPHETDVTPPRQGTRATPAVASLSMEEPPTSNDKNRTALAVFAAEARSVATARALPPAEEESMPLPESDADLQREMEEDLRLSMDVAFTPSGQGSAAPPQLSQSSLLQEEENNSVNNNISRESRGSRMSFDAAPPLELPPMPPSQPSQTTQEKQRLTGEAPRGEESGGLVAAEVPMRAENGFAAVAQCATPAPIVSAAAGLSAYTASFGEGVDSAMHHSSTNINTDSNNHVPPQSPASWPLHEVPPSYIPAPLSSVKGDRGLFGVEANLTAAAAATVTGPIVAGGSCLLNGSVNGGASGAAQTTGRHRTVFSFSSRKAAPSADEDSTSCASAPVAPAQQGHVPLTAPHTTGDGVFAEFASSASMSRAEREGSEHTIMVPPQFVTQHAERSKNIAKTAEHDVVGEESHDSGGAMLLGAPLPDSEVTEMHAALAVNEEDKAPLVVAGSQPDEERSCSTSAMGPAAACAPQLHASPSASMERDAPVPKLDAVGVVPTAACGPLTPSATGEVAANSLTEMSPAPATPTTPRAPSGQNITTTTTTTTTPTLSMQLTSSADTVSPLRVFTPAAAAATAMAATASARPGRTCFTFRSGTAGSTGPSATAAAATPASFSPTAVAPDSDAARDERSTAEGHSNSNSNSVPPVHIPRDEVTSAESAFCHIRVSEPRSAAGQHLSPSLEFRDTAGQGLDATTRGRREETTATVPHALHPLNASVEERNAFVDPQKNDVQAPQTTLDFPARTPLPTDAGASPQPATTALFTTAPSDAYSNHEMHIESRTTAPSPQVHINESTADNNNHNIISEVQQTVYRNEEEGVFASASASSHGVLNTAPVPTAASSHPSGPPASSFDTFYDLPRSVGDFYATRRGVSRLYDWQDELLSQPEVRRGRSFIYSLPTSGGKTLVAELSLLRCVLNRRRSGIFVLPFVSLAEEKTLALQPLTAAFDFNVDGHYGSSGRFPLCEAPAIYVCTIEKANSLLNYMLEEGRTAEIGAVVVDELHMVGESRRGATLELFLSKLLMIDAARQAARERHVAQQSSGAENSNLQRQSGGGAPAGDTTHAAWQGNEEEEEEQEGEGEGYFPDDPAHAVDGLGTSTAHGPEADSFVDPGPLQIIGMSATVPNLHTIAQWLHAACFERDFRPVPLRAYSVVGGLVLRDGQRNERSLTGGSVNQHLLELATEVPEASVLVFCASRQQCVDTARGIVNYLKAQAIAGQQLPFFSGNNVNGSGGGFTTSAAHPPAPSPSVSVLGVDFPEVPTKSAVAAVPSQASAAIKSLLADLEALSHYEASQLSEIVPYGVAFHHGGLLAEERELIEAAFRRKHIRILCSTSTLAAGVNLPARRVIIKTPYVGRDFLTKSRYLQMCGRAGRAGLDPYGESFLLLTRRDQSRGHALMHACVEPSASQLLEDDQTLTRSLLECVGVGLVTDWTSARRWGAALLSPHAVGPVDGAWRTHVTAVLAAAEEKAKAESDAEHTDRSKATAEGEEPSLQFTMDTTAGRLATEVGAVLSAENSESSRSMPVPVAAACAVPPASPSASPAVTATATTAPLTCVPMAALESMVRAALHTLARCGLVDVSYTRPANAEGDEAAAASAPQLLHSSHRHGSSGDELMAAGKTGSAASDGSVSASLTTAPNATTTTTAANTAGKTGSAAEQENDLQVRVTPFGSSSVRSCFSVEEALLLREELDELRHTGLILSDDLHLCYFLTPLREVGECDWAMLRLMMSRMSDSRQRIASLLGVDAYFIDQQAMGLGRPLQASEDGRRRLFTAKRFYVALMLADVLAEVPMATVEQQYNVNRGQLQNLMRSASMFSSSITSFCHAMEWYSLEAVLSSFVKRLGFGVKPDLLPLMEIRGMQPPRARALWNAGFKKLATIAAADADDMLAKVKSMNPPESKSAKFFTKRSALMVIREANLALQSQIKEKKGELQELTARGSEHK